MMDEDSVLEMKPIMVNDGENNGSKMVDSATNTGDLAQPLPVHPTVRVECDQATTASKSLGVRFSQPGRYQP
jgi:hypothetical protein